MSKKNMRRVSLLVTAQTAGNLRKLAKYRALGTPEEIAAQLAAYKRLMVQLDMACLTGKKRAPADADTSTDAGSRTQ